MRMKWKIIFPTINIMAALVVLTIILSTTTFSRYTAILFED